MQNYAKLNIFGILALIALRVGIGWHFYMEGVTKVQGGGFSSEGFVQGAKGPLAPQFKMLLWDGDGRLRLDQPKMNALFEKASRDVVEHFDLTDEQTVKLEKLNERYFGLDEDDYWIGKLNTIYSDYEEEIFKYWRGQERIELMVVSDTWNDVESLRGQREKIEAERFADVRPVLTEIDSLWEDYEAQLNALSNEAQLAAVGPFQFQRPGEGLMSSRFVDKAIPIFDMVVGILLMIGLLTPLAGWAGALFLLSVVLSQMPGTPGAEPTYFQAVEALALVAVATMDAGRYAGLDFLSWTWWQNSKAAEQVATKAA